MYQSVPKLRMGEQQEAFATLLVAGVAAAAFAFVMQTQVVSALDVASMVNLGDMWAAMSIMAEGSAADTITAVGFLHTSSYSLLFTAAGAGLAGAGLVIVFAG